jgi:hypothetical protein
MWFMKRIFDKKIIKHKKMTAKQIKIIQLPDSVFAAAL